ncbi:hypothetical protein K0P33_05290 [Pseudomonas sp. ArH3a]|uniref:hypothetical protein n=1 Tax=Pseudomonas sp. ArH3a TaxID=2862945 RepID=UPI001F5A5A91|nr:hypothetical protein [Pseudomonas sp. ArH3a]UNM20875.1 hypothetical protein K0P33_05290 [Pseudomonas sp. ArH3a]
MSEVKRYHVTEAGLVEGQALGRINVVLGADHDRVTADAERLRAELECSRGDFAQLERISEALQQRLTAADERADVLETALSGMLFAFDDGVGREWSEELLDFARKLTTARGFKAALKPAEGGGDE